MQKEARAGRWEILRKAWYETIVVNCSLCGKMIPRRMWTCVIRGERKSFCSPSCEEMYREYWLPKYAQDAEVRH